MGAVLFTFINYVVQKLPAEQRIQKLSAADLQLCEKKIFRSHSSEQINFNEDLEIKVLDAFFLASTDPHRYKATVMQAMPVFTRALMPKVDTTTLIFLSLLVILFQSETDREGKEATSNLLQSPSSWMRKWLKDSSPSPKTIGWDSMR